MIGIIGAIALATQTKSFQYPDQTRQKLFFLNNQHYICKKLTSSKLSKHIESTHEEFVNNQLSIEEEKRRDEFLDLWIDVKVIFILIAAFKHFQRETSTCLNWSWVQTRFLEVRNKNLKIFSGYVLNSWVSEKYFITFRTSTRASQSSIVSVKLSQFLMKCFAMTWREKSKEFFCVLILSYGMLDKRRMISRQNLQNILSIRLIKFKKWLKVFSIHQTSFIFSSLSLFHFHPTSRLSSFS